MKNYAPDFRSLLLLFVLFHMPGLATATTTHPDTLPATDLWYVTLEFDLEALLNNKKSNEEFPAKLSFKDAEGEMVQWDMKVQVRGRFRRRACEFPPLKMKLPKQKMKEAGFGKHNDVKLVTHCADGKKAQEYLFREYLIYKMYAQLTPVSFRTQLLQVTYRDSRSGDEVIAYGIFIEDSDALAQRLEADACEDCLGLQKQDFDQANLQTHDLFQYMIGNTDWSLAMTRNLKVLNPEATEQPKLLAPYDFDFSGLVNASYAIPNADVNQLKVGDRVYMGADWTADQWENTIQLFSDKRQALIATIDAFEFLNKRARKEMINYLDGFFKQLDKGKLPALLTPVALK